MSSNSSAPPRVGYVESAASMVRDCQSGDPSRAPFCAISTVIGSMSALLLPALILLGITGNTIVAHVMLARLRPLTRQNVYIGCIAVADSLSLLVIGLFNGFLTKGLPWISGGRLAFISYNLSDAMCKASRYALNFCHVLCCLWLLVLVTDRVLAVHRPLAMKKLGRRCAFRALAAAAALAALIALPNGLLVGHQTVLSNGTLFIYCYHLRDVQIFMLVYTTAMSNPPLLGILLMLALDCFLLSRVVTALRRRRALSARAAAQERTKGLSGTVLVLILAVLYLLLHTPVLLARPYLEISIHILDLPSNIDYLTLVGNVYYSSLILGLVNQCITFFVLMRRSKSFRLRVKAMFTRCRVCRRYSQPGRLSDLDLASTMGTNAF